MHQSQAFDTWVDLKHGDLWHGGNAYVGTHEMIPKHLIWSFVIFKVQSDGLWILKQFC